RLGANPAIMVLPIGVESSFIGIVDLLRRKAYKWGSEELGAKYEVSDDIPEDLKEQVEEYRHKLIEKIAETDDILLDKYLNGEEPSVEELEKALRRAVIGYKLVPIYAGSSLRNKGVQPLLDAVVNYLPSPMDLKEVKGHSPKTGEEEKRQLIKEEI